MAKKDKNHDGTYIGFEVGKAISVGKVTATLNDYGVVSAENILHVNKSTLDIIVDKEVDTAWLRTCVTNEGEAKAFEAYNETVSEKQKLTFEEYMELYSRLNLKDYLKK